MLTNHQQVLAERALEFVQPCIGFFIASYPCLREVVDRDELESAARMACVMAARTYDFARGDMRAYFSRAILHELLKSCRKEIRSHSGSVYRVTLEVIERRLPTRDLYDEEPHLPEMLAALHALPVEDRQWITEHVIEGASIRQMARDKGISTRQVAKLMAAKLARLKRLSAACEAPQDRASVQRGAVTP
jgi:DNA-directed RNA polymerase specialized sigma24 family protein